MIFKLKKLNVLGVFILIFILFSTLSQSCLVMENKYSSVAPGTWRAVLQLTPNTISLNKKGEPLPEKMNMKFEESTEGELPFLFEVKYTTEKDFTINVINGEERIPVAPEDIKVGRNKETGKDTILINFPVFGSYIRALYRERVMEGEWVTPAKSSSIPFIAHYGQDYRFTTLKKTPTADLSGKWACDFDLNSKKPYKAVGELKQNGNILRGTFRTETGDYRFLDGEVQADKFYLSCFDGSHAFLFEGRIRPDGGLDGLFRSGKTGEEIWSAKKNEAFELRSADSITTLKNNAEAISFTFPNAEGKPVSLKDYHQKVKIIQIMGTWCPNCRDETNFLTEYIKQANNANLAVIALAFERNAEIAKTQVITYKQKMGVPYEILIAGTTTKKDDASNALPWLNQVIAYPTMVVLDKNNQVRLIHTGFDGPATSKYSTFKNEFDTLLKKILSE
jgi:thiol-disulfide isomerase/thioredoxin